MIGDGTVLIGGRYQLVRRIGRGGMAEVWLATDQRLNGKQVAVKRLLGFSADGPDIDIDVERTRREAYAASRLNHSNLVAVTDFVAEGGEPFIVMEYVEGETLDELIRPSGLARPRVARLIGQVAAALVEAHDAGIVHRDIKPSNIMVTRRDVAKLADFGIARTVGDARLTRPGLVTGTIAYLAPEILENADASSASDVWALGAVLFESIEGRPAFEGSSTAALMASIALREIPKSTRFSELGAIVARMLVRDPAARAPIDSIAEDLAALATGRGAESASRTTLLSFPGRVGDWSGVSMTPTPQPPSRRKSGTPTPPPRSATPNPTFGGAASASASGYMTPWPSPSDPSSPPVVTLTPPLSSRPRDSRRPWLVFAASIVALAISVPVVVTIHGKLDARSKAPTSAASSGSGHNSPLPPAFATMKVLANEGGDERFPEDTIAALRQAAGAGYAVEFDVRWTSDDIAVISHDDHTGPKFSCGDGKRNRRRVSRTTAAELQADCRTAPPEPLGISTFDGAVSNLSRIPPSRSVMFPVIKVVQTPREVETFLSTLVTYGMTGRTVVTSFLPSELAKMRARARSEAVSLRLMRLIANVRAADIPTAAALREEGLWAVGVDYRIATRAYLRSLAQAGLTTIVFTANTDSEWAAARAQGADFVLTDHPRAYLDWRAGR